MRDARVGQGARSRPSTTTSTACWSGSRLGSSHCERQGRAPSTRDEVPYYLERARRREASRRGAPRPAKALPGVVVNRARRTAFASFVSLQLELDRYHVSELSRGGVRAGRAGVTFSTRSTLRAKTRCAAASTASAPTASRSRFVKRVVAFYLRLGLLSRGRTSEALAETEL